MARLSPDAERSTQRAFPEALLSTSYHREIGRIVTASAKLENKLKKALYWSAGINPKTGRLIAKSLRAEEYPSLMLDLLESREITAWPERRKKNKKVNPLKSLRTVLARATEGRDKIVHGLWIKMPGEDRPVLQRVEGHRDDLSGSPITRRLYPEPEPIELQELATIRSDIENALSQLDSFVKELKAAVSSGGR